MTAQHLSDRRRIELALFPRLFLRWMKTANEGKDSDIAILQALTDAEAEAMAAGNLAQRLRRLKRLETALTQPLEAKPLPLCFMAFAFALRDELAAGTLVLREGSAFDRAYEGIRDALLQHADDPDVITEGMADEAETIAVTLRATCRAHGYFKDA